MFGISLCPISTCLFPAACLLEQNPCHWADSSSMIQMIQQWIIYFATVNSGSSKVGVDMMWSNMGTSVRYFVQRCYSGHPVWKVCLTRVTCMQSLTMWYPVTFNLPWKWKWWKTRIQIKFLQGGIHYPAFVGRRGFRRYRFYQAVYDLWWASFLMLSCCTAVIFQYYTCDPNRIFKACRTEISQEKKAQLMRMHDACYIFLNIISVFTTHWSVVPLSS